MKKLKAGIIGAGGIAQYAHIPSFKKAEGVEVAAIADINEIKMKAAAEKFGIPRTFKKCEDMLKEDIDIVSICSPNAFHASQSIKAMKAGKHVLCEKPLCLSEEEVDEVFDTAKRTGMKFMGAMPRRFSGEAKILKTLVENGYFGDIYYMKASYLRRRGIPGLGTWFTNKKLAGGGPMMDIGVHAIDFLVYITRALSPQMVTGSTFSKFTDSATDGGWPPYETRQGDNFIGKMNVEELASGFVKFGNGAVLFIEAGWAGNCAASSSAVILGTKAGFQVPDPSETKNAVRIYGETCGIISDLLPEVPKSEMFQEEVNHFIDCVRNNRETGTMKEEIMAVTRIINGIYKSAETGKPVFYRD
ncbi:MAG TPA: Gfo/Idh/MocA family oxidoreductase [bacterium]|nr:Gfo/Idh/MocA family oxidoreductase [bacterium]